jgi:hypothetical protein
MGSGEEFFQTASARFQSAAERTGLLVRCVQIAGRSVRLRFAGKALAERVLPAFTHLAEAADPPELTIDSFDALTTGTPLPPACWTSSDVGARGEINGLGDERFRMLLDRGARSMSCYDELERHALFFLRKHDDLMFWQMAFPLRQILSWWASGFGALLLHAAAVGERDGVALIPGLGGLGKSSTALSCLLDGMGYLGDDTCLVAPAEPSLVHSLYSAAKLLPDALARLPELRPLGINVPDAINTKVVVPLGERFAAQMLEQAPVTAIVVPERTGRTSTSFTRVTSVRALHALAPNSMFNLVGVGAEGMRSMARIARSAPVFRLELGKDRAAVVRAVRDILAEAHA